MDIDTSYLTTLSEQAVSNANSRKIKDTLSGLSKSAATGGSKVDTAEDEKLLDACKQFESYFVEQMYKEMLKTVPTDELENGSNKMLVDYYKENLVKEYASKTTEQESLGLAQMLYEQMKRNIGVTPEQIDARAPEAGVNASEAKDEKAE